MDETEDLLRGGGDEENVEENIPISRKRVEGDDDEEEEGQDKLDTSDLATLGHHHHGDEQQQQQQQQRQLLPLTQPDAEEVEDEGSTIDSYDDTSREAAGTTTAAESSSSAVADDDDNGGILDDMMYGPGQLLTQAPSGEIDSASDVNDFMQIDEYSNGSISDRQDEDGDDDDDDSGSDGDSDDDHSSSSSSSSGSSSSSSDDEDASLEQDLRDVNSTPRIVRNRRRAIQRNKERLRLLMDGVDRPGGGGTGTSSGGSVDASKQFKMANGENGHGKMPGGARRKRRRVGRTLALSPEKGRRAGGGRRRGMLFATRYNSVEPSGTPASGTPASPQVAPGLSQNSSRCANDVGGSAADSSQPYKSVSEEVGSRFLHREAQIRLLCSIFERTIRQGAAMSALVHHSHERDGMENCLAFVPSPVFVTGPSGAGKTSVVRDVLQTLKRRHADVALTMSQQQQQQQQQQSGNPSSVALSYINCSTVEGSTPGAFLEEAYKQVLRSFFSSDKKLAKRSRKRKRHGTPRKHEVNSKNAPIDNATDSNPSAGNCGGDSKKSHHDNAADVRPSAANCSEASVEEQKEPVTKEMDSRKQSSTLHMSRHMDDYQVDHTLNRDDEEEGFGDIEDQIEQQKKDHLRLKGTLQESNGQDGASKPGDSALSMKRHHTISTPADFGRALLPLCGRPNHHGTKSRYRGCAFLILDQAERLLSMMAKQYSPYTTLGRDERSNLLAQLLLLPRVMGLNLTMVVITSNSLLEFSRTNNVHLQPSASLGTIQDAIHPIRIRFHAYRGKQIYKSILLLPKMKKYVTGCDVASTLVVSRGGPVCQAAKQAVTRARDRIYGAMIKTLLQSLEGTTRDVREMLRFARIFWPIYILPLTSGSDSDRPGAIKQRFCVVLAKTSVAGQQDPSSNLCQDDKCGVCRAVASLDSTAGGNKIESVLEMLDIKGRKPMREIMSKCLFTPMQKLDSAMYPGSCSDNTRLRMIQSLQSSSLAQLSYMAKFLLLSAYLCQNNRKEQDLALFTNHNKGRRRKGRAGSSTSGDPEGTLYASSAAAQQQLRSLRPTAFPIERMISVFSSILSKYGSESEFLEGKLQEDGYLNVSEIGSARLFECLTELRDFGLLRDISGASVDAGTGQIDLTKRKFTCALSNADALAVARMVNIPLQKYLLQEI